MSVIHPALSSCSVEIRRSKTMRSVLTSVQPFTPVTSVAFEASPVPEGMMLTWYKLTENHIRIYTVSYLFTISKAKSAIFTSPQRQNSAVFLLYRNVTIIGT